ncbi:MAG: hypothetical protein AAF997_09735 [Myxococcota bacterium]
MQTFTDRLRWWLPIAVVVSGMSVGCSDDEPTEDFAADCSLCVNGTPVGPSASVAACDAWGAMFDCDSITLINEGLCGGPFEPNATCSVDDCPIEPTGCEEDE